ncbi:hypothetical protein [Paenibacillus endoradicis]|uniref:hypothetical protein n=1 Tax=Paenibacillus endoradicis TaxID=2972487 RepID=UPI002158F167|nr:hypothetical protein [Paenibacillus endoradicis]MCR8657507.1 hypothetical protein [Paenibacillus endoradicis]
MTDKRDIHERLADRIEYGKGFFNNFIKIAFFPLAMAIMMSISLLFSNVAKKIQSSIFSDNNSLLFIPGDASNNAEFWVFISSILYIFIWMIFKFNFRSRKMKIIFNSIVSIMLLGNILNTIKASYDYYDITKEHILIRENRDSKVRMYNFSDISYVEATYRTFKSRNSPDRYYFVYKVYMKNGMEFDMVDSPDFEKYIINVDKILQNNNIEIIRDYSAKYFLYKICENRCSNDILKIYGVSEIIEN